jgi:hypothetical protein
MDNCRPADHSEAEEAEKVGMIAAPMARGRPVVVVEGAV